VTADGSIVLSNGYRNTSLGMLAAPGSSQRFAVAVAPGTLASAIGGRMMITATDAATVHVGVYRKRRLLLETAGQVQPGENMMRLPRRLASGVYDLRVLATDCRRPDRDRPAAPPRPATDHDRLRKATAQTRIRRLHRRRRDRRPTPTDCPRHGPRRVRCRASFYLDFDAAREFHSIALRPDSVLQFRRQRRGRTPCAYAISPSAASTTAVNSSDPAAWPATPDHTDQAHPSRGEGSAHASSQIPRNARKHQKARAHSYRDHAPAPDERRARGAGVL
jgi:hypothetical protein